MPKVNLDTHVLVHALQGSLKRGEQEVLSDHEWGVSSIVLWELAKLRQGGKIDLDLDAPDVADALASLHIWPLTLDVAKQSCELDFSSDPADELIAATSIVYKAPLLTRDQKILSSNLVPFARARNTPQS